MLQPEPGMVAAQWLSAHLQAQPDVATLPHDCVKLLQLVGDRLDLLRGRIPAQQQRMCAAHCWVSRALAALTILALRAN